MAITVSDLLISLGFPCSSYQRCGLRIADWGSLSNGIAHDPSEVRKDFAVFYQSYPYESSSTLGSSTFSDSVWIYRVCASCDYHLEQIPIFTSCYMENSWDCLRKETKNKSTSYFAGANLTGKSFTSQPLRSSLPSCARAAKCGRK